MKIIVVDDMAVMRKMISKILGELEFTNIDTAENGNVAFEKIQAAQEEKEPFQFVISDWNMPECTGIELLKRIRTSDVFKKLPFLMVTAEGEKENLIAAIKAGVSDFVIKPFTKPALKEKILKIVG